MIPSSEYIDTTLDTLDRIFTRFDALLSDNKAVRLVSKLAFIEFCGWLECSLDEIYQEIANKIQNNASKKNAFENITRISTFKRPTFEAIMGLGGIRIIESEYDKLSQSEQAAFEQFLQELSQLQEKRNFHSHSHILAIPRNKTINYFSSPKEIINLCKKIKTGFIVLDKMLRNAKLI